MIYHANYDVFWPDGQLRAKRGEYFEGFNGEDHPVEGQALANEMLGARGQIVNISPAEPPTGAKVLKKIPDPFMGQLKAAGMGSKKKKAVVKKDDAVTKAAAADEAPTEE